MNNRTFRTIGASLVLGGVVIAALVQMASDDAPAELAAAETGITAKIALESSTPETPSTLAPFTYRLGVLSGISTDNFWAYYAAEPSVWNSYVLGPTKPALYSTDPATGELRLELAAADADPTWDSEGWKVLIPLNAAMEWSDGVPVTAADVVFTFETVRALDLGGSWIESYPQPISGIEAADDHTLLVRFESRPNLSVWPHGLGLAPVMPAHVWTEIVEGATAEDLFAVAGGGDVSGGPLELVAATEQVMVSRANSGYPNRGPVDIVEYHVYGSEAEMVAAVIAGEIDSALNPKGVSGADLELIAGDDSVSVMTSPGNGVRYLGFNMKREPMSSSAFRTALALLFDKEAVAEAIEPTASATWSMIPTANQLWFDEGAFEENQVRYAGSIEERLARALDGLKSAGYSWTEEPTVSDGSLVAGEGLTIDSLPPQPLTILTPGDEYDPVRPDYVAAIADTLAILGFDARPVETDFDTVVDLAFTQGDDGILHYDMYMLGWTLGSPTLPDFYGPLFSGSGEMNNTGYSSAAFDSALAEYQGAFTAEEATAAVWEMESWISTDLPYLVLYTSQVTEIYRSDRVEFGIGSGLGGLQGRLGGIGDVRPIAD